MAVTCPLLPQPVVDSIEGLCRCGVGVRVGAWERVWAWTLDMNHRLILCSVRIPDKKK